MTVEFRPTSRREFFTRVGRLVVLVPAGAAMFSVLGCGSSSPSNDCNGEGTNMSTGSALISISSCTGPNGGHVHDFTIQDTDLATPPAAGVAGNSSPYDDDQHVHAVALTQAELTMIQAGTTVSKVSGNTLNHTHTFTFKKV